VHIPILLFKTTNTHSSNNSLYITHHCKKASSTTQIFSRQFVGQHNAAVHATFQSGSCSRDHLQPLQ